MKRSRLFRRHAILALASVGLAACTVSPQPEPPVIDISRLSFEPGPQGLVLKGGSGAVTARASLAVLDLDDTSPAKSTAIDESGAFSLDISGAAANEFRLQATLSSLTSEPVDITGGAGLIAGGPVLPASRPLADCFHLDPALELGPLAKGQKATVTTTNGCAASVTVNALTLRLPSASWSVTGGTPIDVPTSGSQTFDVAFTPAGDGVNDDVLFVELASPVAGRRPITLRGR